MSKLIIAIVAYLAIGFLFRWVFQILTKYAHEKKDYNELILWWPWIVSGVVVLYVIYGFMELTWRLGGKWDKMAQNCIKKFCEAIWRN